jgi:26S proteasome non-ATPase regulatory subunit 10
MFHLGDTAIALLKAGAETDRKDVDGYLAIDLAPDKQVSIIAISTLMCEILI